MTRVELVRAKVQRLRIPILIAILGAPALAADYGVDDPEWSGLSTLAELAQTEGLSVESRTDLDWGEVTSKDVLFMLYPTTYLDPAQVVEFIEGGGRLLVADDFGTATDVLGRLGIERREARGVMTRRWYDDRMDLPVASAAMSDHPLTTGARELITNHPAVFHVTSGRVVYRFGADEAVVVADQRGAGRFVALSDPSVLINAMLAFESNASFAANLLGWLAPASTPGGRLIVLTQDIRLSGTPALAPGPHGPLSRRIRDLGGFLAELNEYLASPEVMRALGVLGAFLVVVVASLALPTWRAPRKLDGAWTRMPVARNGGGYEDLVRTYDAPRFAGNFAYPAAVLREEVEARIANARGEVLSQDLITRLQALPSRAEVQASFSTRIVTRREFEDLYQRTRLGHGLGRGPKDPS